MKQLLAYLLVAAIGLNVFSELGIYISFKINQDYIAKNLCVERDNPNSTCHGCCQLEKKMKTDEQQKQENSQSTNKKSEIQFFPSDTKIAFPNFYRTYKTFIPKVIDTGVLLSKSLFRPPKNNAWHFYFNLSF